ncbi:acyl-CoA N-acyltransferase [Athelia psychrophila]|uniref:Acyl-CoA N-acyltransferase n=1 Tax=Athelia psychrophila TaxID=1759441 RepID=A0A166N0K2_9AGAM|nr:acyl-CoA N-acyltransferase [Fibularhizoctonia sp. CBS 109695]
MNIRLARVNDLLGMQACNLQGLPENNKLPFYLHHLLTWPSLSFVAEDHHHIIGYILAKIMDGADGLLHGHVKSLCVRRSYRRLGIATKLVIQSRQAMSVIYRATFVSLSVRKSNYAAIALYRNALGFIDIGIKSHHYADGEDAYSMKLML